MALKIVKCSHFTPLGLKGLSFPNSGRWNVWFVFLYDTGA